VLISAQDSRTVTVFICYRRKDGQWHADWIDQALNGLTYTDKAGAACRISTYYDRTAPGVANWKEHHFPSLQAARALIVIGTPGISKDLSKPNDPDWVYEELRWWAANHPHPPIVVDTTGEGARWLPEIISATWPNLNRLDLDKDEAESARAAGDQLYLSRWRERVVGTIVESEQATLFEENVRLKRHRRNLAGALAAVMLALFAAAGFWYRSIQSEWQARESERQAKESDEASRQTIRFISDLFARADPDKSFGESLTAGQLLRAGTTAARRPDVPARVKWRVLHAMGAAYTGLGENELSVNLLKEAAKLTQGMSLDPSSRYQLEFALGEALMYMDNFDEAQPHFEEASRLAEAMHAGNHADRSAALIAMGDLEAWPEDGSYEIAKERYTAALKMDEALGHEIDVARDHNRIGYLEYYSGNAEAAATAIRKSMDVARKALKGDSNVLVAQYQQDFAGVLYLDGELEQADALYRNALREFVDVYGIDSGEVASIESNIARICIERGQIDEARSLLLHVVQIQEKKFGAEFRPLAFSLNNLALVNMIDGQFDDAKLKFQRAARIAEAHNLHIGAQSLTHEAEIDLVRQRTADAATLLDKAADVVSKHKLDGWRLAIYQSARAELHLRRCELDSARQLLARTTDAFNTRWKNQPNVFTRADLRRQQILKKALANPAACKPS
jgi:tetratricopeptide (TPR) repeat protein